MEFLYRPCIILLAAACRDNASRRDTGYAAEVDGLAGAVVTAGCVVVESESVGVLLSESAVMIGTLDICFTLLGVEVFLWPLGERMTSCFVVPWILAGPSHFSLSLQKLEGRCGTRSFDVTSHGCLCSIRLRRSKALCNNCVEIGTGGGNEKLFVSKIRGWTLFSSTNEEVELDSRIRFFPSASSSTISSGRLRLSTARSQLKNMRNVW